MALSGLQTRGWNIAEDALNIALDLAEQKDRLNDSKRLEEFLLDVSYLKTF